jgi:hypothetical protein
MNTITQERLKKILRYEANTGEFFWVNPLSNRVKAGSKAGSLSHGYLVIMVDKKKYSAHRLAWLYVYGKFPDLFIDHIDCNPLNNLISNLREATQQQNLCNTRKFVTNTSGYKGVHFHKGSRKWRAVVSINNKPKHLGLFITPEDASSAYNAWCLENRGIFFRVNT